MRCAISGYPPCRPEDKGRSAILTEQLLQLLRCACKHPIQPVESGVVVCSGRSYTHGSYSPNSRRSGEWSLIPPTTCRRTSSRTPSGSPGSPARNTKTEPFHRHICGIKLRQVRSEVMLTNTCRPSGICVIIGYRLWPAAIFTPSNQSLIAKQEIK
jgi:hypothetical protein